MLMVQIGKGYIKQLVDIAAYPYVAILNDLALISDKSLSITMILKMINV